MSLTLEDEELILDCFDERSRLKSQLRNLTNEALAAKFEVPKAEIAALQKRGMPHARIQSGASGSNVRYGARGAA
jgi:hypothetical protein